MNDFFYVYILVSRADKRKHYTGITRDLRERLVAHNEGACARTTKFRPWRIETAIAFTSESKAQAFERYLKSGSGREFSRRHF
jgi:putative endonuclease